jgi:hypothetical protein
VTASAHPPPSRPRAPPPPRQLLKEKLSFRFNSVREAFKKFDQNFSGFIEDEEFRNARAWEGRTPWQQRAHALA